MRYTIALLAGLLLSVPLWGIIGGADERGTAPGHSPRTGTYLPQWEAPKPDLYPDPVFTPAPKGWLPPGVTPSVPQRENGDGRIEEDEPGWNCATMGNRSCG